MEDLINNLEGEIVVLEGEIESMKEYVDSEKELSKIQLILIGKQIDLKEQYINILKARIIMYKLGV